MFVGLFWEGRSGPRVPVAPTLAKIILLKSVTQNSKFRKKKRLQHNLKNLCCMHDSLHLQQNVIFS